MAGGGSWAAAVAIGANGAALVFAGTGIQENLADKAKRLGIPVMKFEKGA